jgi:hypothetical protein
MRANDKPDPRTELVALAKAMLAGELPYAEGAYQICRLRGRIEGLADQDQDFDAFMLIESETDHLPLQAQRHLWSDRALKELEPEFERSQTWARVICGGSMPAFDSSVQSELTNRWSATR